MSQWTECAERLIGTGELDPVYTMLCSARDRGVVDNEWLGKFCMYQLMFYHIPGALKAAEQDDFWDYIQKHEPTLPRGQERRHFRGLNAKSGIYSLMHPRLDPLRTLFTVYDPDYRVLYRNIQANFLGFGEYFILKWADLLDVVFHKRVDYRHLGTYLFSGAKAGLAAAFPGKCVYPDALEEIVDYIRLFPDPFDGSRPCGPAEAETVACGFKVYYVNTTFKFGYDIHHLRVALEGYPELLKGCPPDTEEWK